MFRVQRSGFQRVREFSEDQVLVLHYSHVFDGFVHSNYALCVDPKNWIVSLRIWQIACLLLDVNLCVRNPAKRLNLNAAQL